MNYYEITCLTAPSLSGEEIREISEKIKNFIKEESGTLEKTAFPSEDNSVSFARIAKRTPLIVLSFFLEPKNIENIEKKIKSENQILRHMLLSKKIYKENPARKNLLKKTGDKRERAASPGKNKKVELEEIDKKIEEILKINE